MKLAIVGTGISGLVCAHLLHEEHEVTLFEAGGHVGGHTLTSRIERDGREHWVDAGFIVYNEVNYPNFVRLLDRLEVEARARDLPMLMLETGNVLHAAHRLYARAGFAERGPFGDYPAANSSLFMEKRLG